MDPVDAIDDPVCILESGEHGMVSAGGRIFFEGEVGVEHGAFFAAGEGSSKERGETEIFARHAPFIVERGFIGGHDATASLDEFTDLGTLLRRQRRDVGQDQGAKLFGVLTVEQMVVHHFERDSGFDERLIKAQCGIVHGSDRIDPSIERGGLLGIDHAYAGQGFLVAEIILVGVMPLEDFFHHGKPALIVGLRVELGEGRTEILGYAVGHPEPDFVAALHGILPAILILQADAEDTRDGFASECGTKLFGAFACGPGGAQAARPWRSASRVGAISPTVFISNWLSAPPPVLAM